MDLKEITPLIQSLPASRQWNRIGIKHHHGISVPLFSLHSEQSGGIGEYLDLDGIIDWCGDLKLDIIQLLPLNDNGRESSPYSAISAFALNPIHLSLHALPGWEKISSLKAIYESLKSLNSKPRVDYNTIFTLKEDFLRKYFAVTAAECLNSPAFHEFKASAHWLEKYAVFKTLKIKTHWISWSLWPEKWKYPQETDIAALIKELPQEIEFHQFVQFHCFNQFSNVHQRAEKRGVRLKGDIPILLSYESADVWGNQSLFKLNYSAGAPPDMFNPDGQDWGFPLYNWEEIEKQNYSWWKDRLQTAARCYSLYRLDHIVGFYRIFARNLAHPNATKGFIPEDSKAWITHGEKILKALIASTDMLPIGEDLGVVPPEVRQNLRSLGICGTKVMRWERKWHEDSCYIPFSDYEPLSMTTVSTHDSETLQIWWKLETLEVQEFAKFKKWNYNSELTKEQHYEILFDSHHTASLFHINLLQEYLALVPGRTWEDPLDERINVPGTVSDRNWSYKFRPSVEEIVSDLELKRIMTAMIRT